MPVRATTHQQLVTQKRPLKSLLRLLRHILGWGEYLSGIHSISEAQVSHRHAHYTLGDYTAAAAAFRRGLELDPSNANLKSGLSNSEDRISTDDDPPPLIPDENFPPAQSPSSQPNAGAGLGNMADMLGGMGGGGMPDMASMMSNPMFMQMAQNMMANGGLESL
jgi:hypothetical protein